MDICRGAIDCAQGPVMLGFLLAQPEDAIDCAPYNHPKGCRPKSLLAPLRRAERSSPKLRQFYSGARGSPSGTRRSKGPAGLNSPA